MFDDEFHYPMVYSSVYYLHSSFTYFPILFLLRMPETTSNTKNSPYDYQGKPLTFGRSNR